MSRSKKQRKAYRPRSTIGAVSALNVLMVRAESSANDPAPKEKTDRLMTTFLSALDTISRGQHPGAEEWRLLSDAINHVETLALRGHLQREAVQGLMDGAISSMVDAARRWRDGGPMRMDGNGLSAVRELISVYEFALRELPELDIAMAHLETQQRVTAAQAGRPVNDRAIVAV